LPVTFKVTVPKEAVGEIGAVAMAADNSGTVDAYDEIALKVEQTADLISFDFGDCTDFYFTTDWDGNPDSDDEEYIRVDAVYSDKITRDISREELTYSSSDLSVASVDNQGNIKPQGLGEAIITVSKGDVSGTVKVYVEEPRGIRPSETIPPTIQLDIQPSANELGWNNQDITITIIAQDNEGGSGIREITYSILGTEDMQNKYVEDAEVKIFFDKEGSYELVCSAIDKEGNYGQTHRHNLNLDKTPPKTTAVISPQPDASGWIRSLPAKVRFVASDHLSGVAFTTPEKIFTEVGTYQVEYYSKDVAGNVEQPKTVTVNIAQ